MLNEYELKRLIEVEKDHLNQVMDLDTRQRMRDYIHGLETVLDE